MKQSNYVAVTKDVEIASRHRQMPTLWARNDEVGSRKMAVARVAIVLVVTIVAV